MSNRSSFWYGLGIGLVAGALLLEMMTFSSPNAQGNELANIDAAKMKQLADSNGYKLYAKSDTLYTEQQVNDRIKQVQQAATPQSTPPSSPPTPTPAAATAKPPVSVYISKGNTAAEIAAMLTDAGLISNQSSFEQKLQSRKIDTKIDRGTFTFTADMSEDDIISNIVIRSP